MKKKIVWILLAGMVLTSCGTTTTQTNQNNEIVSEMTEQQESKADTEEISASETTELAAEKIALSEGERTFFEEYLKGMENNGFLFQGYTSPEAIDPNILFYNGAGLTNQTLSEEEKAAYFKETGTSFFDTDVIALTKTQMDDFLQQKAYGDIALSDLKISMEWIYLPEYDLYVTEHGDTSYQPITVLSGYKIKTENSYVIYYQSEYSEPKHEVKLYQDGSTYRFYSDRVLSDSEKIEEPADSVNATTVAGDKGNADNALDNLSQSITLNSDIVDQFNRDADTSKIENFGGFQEFSNITEDKFIGLWYANSNDGQYPVALYLTEQGALIYYPALDFYGDQWYDWEVIDRSDRGLDPELAIYFNGRDCGPLAYYVAGITEEVFWSYSQGDVFYRQDESLLTNK